MRNNEYLTVAEFAAIAGISKQAVYQRLNTSLKGLFKVEQGKKYIHISALDKISDKSDFKDFQFKVSTEQDSANYDSIIQILTTQLKEKDKQIERLQEELRRSAVSADEKDKYIQEQGRRLAELLEQANKLQENNQVLIGLANDYKAKLEEGSSSNSNEKKGFFRRLFKDSE